MEVGIYSFFFPSPSLLLLNMYYGRKHVLGSSCASRILGWNRSQEYQGWDLEWPRKSTKSAGLGRWKSESSSELDQQLSLWVILHSLPSPPPHTHPSFRFDKRALMQNGKMTMSPRQNKEMDSFLQQYWEPALLGLWVYKQSKQRVPHPGTAPVHRACLWRVLGRRGSGSEQPTKEVRKQGELNFTVTTLLPGSNPFHVNNSLTIKSRRQQL